MASYFLDSSALVKHYVAELGTGWMRSLTDLAAGNDLYLVQITGVEVTSALVRHQPPLPSADLTIALLDFRHDFRNQYRVLPVDWPLVKRAMGIAGKHRLRGYDAIQLAGAIRARQTVLGAGLPGIILVSSDIDLNNAALAEGFTVDNPLAHP